MIRKQANIIMYILNEREREREQSNQNYKPHLFIKKIT